jgi:hypothetical protein
MKATKINLSFILLTICTFSFSQKLPENCVWLSEKYVSNSIQNKNIKEDDLFPIEGFQTINGELYILTFKGELNRLNLAEYKNGKYEISNFCYLLNMKYISRQNVKKICNSKVYYTSTNDKIIVYICNGSQTRKIIFSNDIYNLRFSDIFKAKLFVNNKYKTNHR